MIRTSLPRATLALALSAACAVPAAAGPLPGVADEETKIPFGRIADYQRGNGDVLFVRDTMNRWYRVEATGGCLQKRRNFNALSFTGQAGTGTIDRFSSIRVDNLYSCRVESIRRSEAPPQVDSQSRVTLD